MSGFKETPETFRVNSALLFLNWISIGRYCASDFVLEVDPIQNLEFTTLEFYKHKHVH